MTDTPIQHVTDTAFWVATFRARESERQDALFQDPLAARLVAGRGESITQQMRSGGVVGWSVVIRTCIIDDFVLRAINEGCDCVLNLGAGLDTRPYRLALPASLSWIEVDFPDTIAFKEKTLAGEAPRCQLERIGLDLSDNTARDALLASINARFGKILVLTEGVVIYLDNAVVASLADALHAQPHIAFWVSEHLAFDFLRVSQRLRHRQQLKHAPWIFAPGDWSAFFATHGWAMHERRALVEEGIRRKRLPQMPWWAKLALTFASRKRRESVRQGFAYTLMTRS